jgi:hypothetical protein
VSERGSGLERGRGLLDGRTLSMQLKPLLLLLVGACEVGSLRAGKAEKAAESDASHQRRCPERIIEVSSPGLLVRRRLHQTERLLLLRPRPRCPAHAVSGWSRETDGWERTNR